MKLNKINLVGFVHQYEEDDFSMWNVQLSEEDTKDIEAILEKYQDQGFSVRGNSQIKIEEAF